MWHDNHNDPKDKCNDLEKVITTTMSNSTSQRSGLLGTVFIIFLILKLVGVIDWSWWWVTSPLWIGIVIVTAIFLVVVLFLLLALLFKRTRANKP